MKKTRRISAILLAIIMALSVYSPTNAAESVLQEASSKIDSELHSVMLSSEKIDEIPVDIWLYEPFSTEQLEKEIYSKIGITKQKIKQSEERDISAEKVDEYIETERALYSEKMDKLYKDFLKDYSKVKALNETRSNKRLFFSKYAPLISAELTPAEIKQLAKDERVRYIYYSPNVELVPQSNISVPLIQADYVRDTLGYTGNGIKIGMIESGLPNKNNSYFTAANITYDPNITNPTYTPHANRVAAIMVAKSTTVNGVTYKGIVPDATLYATSYNGHPTDWRTRVEWLLSQGVHVINMSARLLGVSDEINNGVVDGEYGNQELWLDHIALNHSVHFVVVAGNNTQYITSPGMAYNVITVGAINDNNTANHYDDHIYSDSCYREDSGLTNKPDLMAPGENIATAAGSDSGTSYAAPHVTATVAQLCQRQPSLKTQQDAVKAILTASINHSTLAFTSADTLNYNKFGAGVISAQAAVASITYSRYISSSFAANTPKPTSHYYNFNVTTKGSKERVSLTWLKYSYLTGTHTNPTQYEGNLTNLNLTIYDPNGNFVVYSADTYNNTEIVEFTSNMIGTYQIVVTAASTSNRTTYYAVAWY